MTFNDANAVIKLNDKDLGVIIGEGYLSDIAGHAGGINTYFVSIRPVIKSEIKDGKVRITYSVPYYEVEKWLVVVLLECLPKVLVMDLPEQQVMQELK